jgi:dipeptidyl aminopeptidase/acylaminoacyl peptidase
MKPRPSSDIPGPFRRGLLIAAGALAAIVAVYLGVCDLVLSSILAPVRVLPEETPSDAGLAAEPVRFVSDGDELPLVGWLLPSSGDRAIVLVHGVDSNGWSGGHPDIARAYVEAGFHVLVFDLRGHGRSGGDRLGLGWHERRDVRAAVNLLLERGFEPGRIGIHGTSYGAAVALLSAAAIPEIGAVVADSAFADARDVMDREIEKRTGLPAPFVRRFLGPGLRLVAKLRHSLDFDAITPERAVPKIAPRPILFIHGSEDPVIPVEHAHRLKAASKNAADELWILEGLEHTDGVRMGALQKEVSPMRDAFLRKVTAFFDRTLP